LNRQNNLPQSQDCNGTGIFMAEAFHPKSLGARKNSPCRRKQYNSRVGILKLTEATGGRVVAQASCLCVGLAVRVISETHRQDACATTARIPPHSVPHQTFVNCIIPLLVAKQFSR
jgi:hypothetical protein